MQTDQKIRVLFCDDKNLIIEGLTSDLNEVTFFEITGRALNSEDAIEQYFELKPDIIILNVSMRGINGIETLLTIRQRDPEVKALLFTEYDREELIFYAVKAGAKGLLNKYSSFADLSYALLQIYSGRTFFGTGLNDYRINEIIKKYEGKCPQVYLENVNLTDTEKEVLRLYLRGYHIKDIAVKLNKSKKTVENQVYCIKKKLNLKTKEELLKYVSVMRPEINIIITSKHEFQFIE